MIPDLSYTAEIWLFAALLAAALSGFHLWRIARREETQRLRLEAFRGAGSSAMPTGGRLPWHRRLGSLIAVSPIVGTVEQQRLVKLLAAAGIKGRGSLANFLAIKVCAAIVFAALAWLLLEWWHLFAGMAVSRFAALGAALILGWRLPDLILNHLIKRRRLRLEHGMPAHYGAMADNATVGGASRRSFRPRPINTHPDTQGACHCFDEAIVSPDTTEWKRLHSCPGK